MSSLKRCLLPVVGVLLGTLQLAIVVAAERPGPIQTAIAVDRQLAEEIQLSTASQLCSDEVFLRRATLDILGRNPTVEEITAFALDPAPAKRADLVGKLLADTAYGENWGRYWRDVIMYRRSEDRALLASAALQEFLASELNKNTPWDQIATAFITAEGNVVEEGATGLFMAQQGRPEETTAEIARIFLGIQIQCAQCHDHPTDRWKREQFHELAAFFPRVSVRPVRDSQGRAFEVVGDDTFRRFGRAMNDNRFRGTAEHHMPDLEDPSADGKLMQPKFFLTGQTLKLGAKDQDRRQTLSDWLTDKDNPWFAKALVNRLWSELVGEGFYEPVDDMGPDRECNAPKTLDLLASRFAASGYDVKWLMATIMTTDAYQRRSDTRRAPDQQPFASSVAQRLRSDQLYNNLIATLGVPDSSAGRGRGAYGLARTPRLLFSAVFGYDPSNPRDEVSGSIPQALAMMNSPVINSAISARGRTTLAQLVSEIKDDRALVVELYLRTLARQPSESEITTSLTYIKEVNDRAEAFEDLQWALINSTEFLHRK